MGFQTFSIFEIWEFIADYFWFQKEKEKKGLKNRPNIKRPSLAQSLSSFLALTSPSLSHVSGFSSRDRLEPQSRWATWSISHYFR